MGRPLIPGFTAFCMLCARQRAALIRIGRCGSYRGMPVKLLRQMLALLIVTAYVGATMLQPAPAAAASASAMSGMMQEHDSQRDHMPCKGMVPHCITDLGCVFLVSLPAMPGPAFYTAAEWSPVNYAGSPQMLHGRSIKPALGPPITLV